MNAHPRIIGLHGSAGAGKDTVFQRIDDLYPDKYVRMSFADALKDSACALLKIDRERMEMLKRQNFASIHVTLEPPTRMNPVPARIAMTMREFLQLYGTESHRDQFGDTFWVDRAMCQPQVSMIEAGFDTLVPVFTDVRFENEAREIWERDGQVWRIDGPAEEGAAGHSSEVPLDDMFIHAVIDNSIRNISEFVSDDGDAEIRGDYSHLDQQIMELIG